VDAEGCHQHGPPRVAELVASDALVGQHGVVLEGTGLGAAVNPVLEMRRQGSGQDRLVQDRLVPLRHVEGADEVVAGLQLGPEDLDPSKGPARHPAGLGAHEGGREDHVVAEHKAVDVQMVPVELPAPGLIG